MTDTIEDLQRRMDAAASALDFEEARRLRDRINLMRGGASAAEAAEADTSDLVRQQPGAMGLGTSQQRLQHFGLTRAVQLGEIGRCGNHGF